MPMSKADVDSNGLSGLHLVFTVAFITSVACRSRKCFHEGVCIRAEDKNIENMGVNPVNLSHDFVVLRGNAFVDRKCVAREINGKKLGKNPFDVRSG